MNEAKKWNQINKIHWNPRSNRNK